jgi:tetratricopeptide (TPR) repeat protein
LDISPMRLFIFGVLMGVISTMTIANAASDDNKKTSNPAYAIVGGQEQLTPFPDNERTRRIVDRTEIEREASELAVKGLYDQAIQKYRQAMGPSLLNNSYDESGGRYGVVKALIRQGRFEEALKEYQWFIDQNKTNDAALEEQKELLALIKSKESNSSEPIYEHIAYLKKKHSKQLPPTNYSGVFSAGIISNIVHLYDYLGDADSAINFMNVNLKYLRDNNKKDINRFIIAEYERAKKAFEEDKITGQKGHLQKVIETSNYIGW